MSKSDTQVTSLDDESADAVAVAAPASSARGAKAAASKAADAAPSDPNRIVSLTIHQGQGDGGNDAVFVSVNEYARLIPRGVPVDVPAAVVGVLDQAVQTTYHTEGKNVIERQVPRYAYTVRG